MKTIKTALIILTMLLPVAGLQAQMSDNIQSYWIHEDVVKPSMAVEYETVVKELLSNMKKHNIQEASFVVTNTDDYRYLYVAPIENMAQLDKPVFATLAEKMGSEAMTALFNRMDKCYDTEHDYVLNLDKSLSYMPDGITQTPEGKDYRMFHYLYVTPGNRAMVKEKMKAVKAMFETKGSKEYYRVYKSGFGTRGEFYMVAIAAADAVDHAMQTKANEELLGEEGNKLFGELFGSLLKYEGYTGRMRPDMFYVPE